MYKQILTTDQLELLPLLKSFPGDYYLVGGTAIALQIGHRRSIDFDLFTNQEIRRLRLKRIIQLFDYTIEDTLYEAFDQLHIMVNSVKLTFFNYPYKIEPVVDFEQVIQMPSLLDLSAMKAFSLGGRAKWKDYVDLYFIFKNYFDLKTVSKRAKEIFGNEFNEKLFREQLSYYEDIDYTEGIDFIDEIIEKKVIQDLLTTVSLESF